MQPGRVGGSVNGVLMERVQVYWCKLGVHGAIFVIISEFLSLLGIAVRAVLHDVTCFCLEAYTRRRRFEVLLAWKILFEYFDCMLVGTECWVFWMKLYGKYGTMLATRRGRSGQLA